jgi:hypothetical protein
MDERTALMIGEINGRISGHDEALTDMGGKIDRIHGSVGRMEERQGRIDEKLDRVLGSGPYPIFRPAQEATERKTETFMGRVNHLLMNPKILHVLYPLLALMALAMVLSFYSGRPASDFFRFDATPASRSGIGPLERLGAETSKATSRSTTHEGASHGAP